MTAIYKKELRSYFTSMTGYICMAFMLVVIGIYFAVINLSSGYPYFGYTLSCVIVLFLLMTPVLTMRILAEEKNRKTDQLLLTAPVSLWKIVIGKYLAMVTVFGLALLITCFYPLILSRFGTVSLPMAYTAILGYFLYGAACIAIGLFISSVTESQVIAALLTFFVLLVFYITGVITNALPSTAVASFVIWIFVILFAAWLVYNLTSNIKIAVAAAIIAEAVNVIIFFAKSEWMAGSVAKVLGAFNMTSFFSNFGSGVFDITGIVYYLSIIGFCIFLTIQSIQRKRWGGDALMTAVVLAIVVVINLVVGQIPVKYTQFDLTDNQLYTITDQTKTFVKGLDSDVDVYLVAQSGQEDEQIQKVLERYESLSSHIKVHTKDPVVNPSFTKQYTDSSLSDNSLIVVCGEKYKVINYSDIYQSEFNYSTYSSQTTGFDAEGQLTSAIDYVTSDTLPKLYTLTGHDEAFLSGTLTSQIEKENIQLEQLSLLNVDSIPEDAAGIMIYAPASDISGEEQTMLADYTKNGGKLFAAAGPVKEGNIDNLHGLLEEYGVTAQDGIVVEGDRERYALQTPYALLPQMESSDITDSLIAEHYYPILPIVQGLKVDETKAAGRVTTLLSTTDQAFSKMAGYELSTYEREEGDVDGPFAAAVSISCENEGRILWFGSSDFLEDMYNALSSGANGDLGMNGLSSMIGESEAMAIRSKSLNYNYLTISESTSAMLQAVMIGVFPLAYLGIGICVVMRRRRMQNEAG